MTFFIILFLSAIVFVQFAINWALLNRLLTAKGVQPVLLPEVAKEEPPAPQDTRRKLFSIAVAE